MTPVRVASGLIVKDGEILLGFRAAHKRICPNRWDLIGGHLEAGETPEAALLRELDEEIGAVPTRFRLLEVLDFSEEAGENVFMHVFLVQALSASPRLANGEHAALAWFPLGIAAELPDLASERYRPILRTVAADAKLPLRP